MIYTEDMIAEYERYMDEYEEWACPGEVAMTIEEYFEFLEW